MILWCNIDKLYELNDDGWWRLHNFEEYIGIVKDYVLIYGKPYKYFRVVNLYNNAEVFFVEFMPIGGIELDIKTIRVWPKVNGWKEINGLLCGLNLNKIYKFNEMIKREKTMIIDADEYIVAFGEPDKWINVINLNDDRLIFRVEFNESDKLDVEIEYIEMHPHVVGWNKFSDWLVSKVL